MLVSSVAIWETIVFKKKVSPLLRYFASQFCTWEPAKKPFDGHPYEYIKTMIKQTINHAIYVRKFCRHLGNNCYQKESITIASLVSVAFVHMGACKKQLNGRPYEYIETMIKQSINQVIYVGKLSRHVGNSRFQKESITTASLYCFAVVHMGACKNPLDGCPQEYIETMIKQTNNHANYFRKLCLYVGKNGFQ